MSGHFLLAAAQRQARNGFDLASGSCCNGRYLVLECAAHAEIEIDYGDVIP